MRKITAVFLLAIMIVQLVPATTDLPSSSAFMTQTEMSCAVGGELDCDDGLTMCLAIAPGFREKLSCFALWGLCKVILE